MRWRHVACVLWLAGLTGCPHAFGRGGTIDHAVKTLCPEGQPPSAKCLEQCGDVLDERG
jgi:hypothetical protein